MQQVGSLVNFGDQIPVQEYLRLLLGRTCKQLLERNPVRVGRRRVFDRVIGALRQI